MLGQTADLAGSSEHNVAPCPSKGVFDHRYRRTIEPRLEHDLPAG